MSLTHDIKIRKEWGAAGGSFHGPKVETGTMPEAQLMPYLRSLYARIAELEARLAQREADFTEGGKRLQRYRDAIDILAYVGVFKDADELKANIEFGKFNEEYEITKSGAIDSAREEKR